MFRTSSVEFVASRILFRGRVSATPGRDLEIVRKGAMDVSIYHLAVDNVMLQLGCDEMVLVGAVHIYA
jgi:hypothetical protein